MVKRQTNQNRFPQQFPQHFPEFGQNFPLDNQFSGHGQVVTQAPAVTTDTNSVTTLSPATLDCIRLCPRTVEYNAVCGTNNVTYDNRSHLKCAQSCGIGKFSNISGYHNKG